MTTTISELPPDANREREVEKARADVRRRAEAQGVKPFISLDDFSGDEPMTADFDVDEFLRQVRTDRDRPSMRSDG